MHVTLVKLFVTTSVPALIVRPVRAFPLIVNGVPVAVVISNNFVPFGVVNVRLIPAFDKLIVETAVRVNVWPDVGALTVKVAPRKPLIA